MEKQKAKSETTQKTLRDYVGEDIGENVLSTADIGIVWSNVLKENLKEVNMISEEFFYFVRYFMNQLPHDWDKKTFMGVKINRI